MNTGVLGVWEKGGSVFAVLSTEKQLKENKMQYLQSNIVC